MAVPENGHAAMCICVVSFLWSIPCVFVYVAVFRFMYASVQFGTVVGTHISEGHCSVVLWVMTHVLVFIPENGCICYS
jgi:hypothetical protein